MTTTPYTRKQFAAQPPRYADVKVMENVPGDAFATRTTTVALDLPFPEAQQLRRTLWDRFHGNGTFIQAWIVEIRPIGGRDRRIDREEARQNEWDRHSDRASRRRSANDYVQCYRI